MGEEGPTGPRPFYSQETKGERYRYVPKAIHHPHSLKQEGSLIPLSLWELSPGTHTPAGAAIPSSSTAKALSPHSSRLARWLLGLCRAGPAGAKEMLCWKKGRVSSNSSSESENTQK